MLVLTILVTTSSQSKDLPIMRQGSAACTFDVLTPFLCRQSVSTTCSGKSASPVRAHHQHEPDEPLLLQRCPLEGLAPPLLSTCFCQSVARAARSHFRHSCLAPLQPGYGQLHTESAHAHPLQCTPTCSLWVHACRHKPCCWPGLDTTPDADLCDR